MSGVPDKVMSQSHTSMSCFATCPRQYEAKYVTKEVKFEQGEAAAWGDEVHKALEALGLTGVQVDATRGEAVFAGTVDREELRRAIAAKGYKLVD